MMDKTYLLALDKALDDLGVYPKGFYDKGEYKERTPWQDGWNECQKTLLTTTTRISKFLDKYPELIPLVEKDKIHFNLDDKKLSLYVLCNDLFFWACADGEEITIAEIPSLIDCLNINQEYGELLWCCKKRKMRPQAPYYNSFPQYMKPLFDMCGPERK